jgi:hypothetical protein
LNERAVEALLAFFSSAFEVTVGRLGIAEDKPADAQDLLAARRALQTRALSTLEGREHDVVAFARVRRTSQELAASPTLMGRVEEMGEAAAALKISDKVLRRKRFAVLEGRGPDVYRQVLTTAAYSPSGARSESESELRLMFATAADVIFREQS